MMFCFKGSSDGLASASEEAEEGGGRAKVVTVAKLCVALAVHTLPANDSHHETSLVDQLLCDPSNYAST